MNDKLVEAVARAIVHQIRAGDQNTTWTMDYEPETPSFKALAVDGELEPMDIAKAAIEAAGVGELVEALDMCRMIIKFHVKDAGACVSKDEGRTMFSALDAYNAALTAIAKAIGDD